LSCESCSFFGAKCSECNAGGCLKCDGNFVLNATGDCVSCSDIYGDGCRLCDETSCLAVHEFTIIGKVAMKCADLYGDGCAKCNSDGCISCSEGFHSFDGVCKKCSEVFGKCVECETSSCTKCENSMIPFIHGVCADCSSAFGEGCNECDAFNCTAHRKGYFIYNGLAISCSVLPERLQEQCTNSIRGIPDSSHIFNDVLSDSITIYFQGEPVTTTCNQIVPHCISCRDSEGSLSCEGCEDGFFLYGGICKPCRSVYGEYCESCSLISCDNCAETISTSISNLCLGCQSVNPHCSSCSNANDCSECIDGFIEKNGECVSCQTVFGDGCSHCNSTDCITCIEDDCCPDGAKIIYANNVLSCGTCDKLTEDCVSCTSTTCLGCANGKVVDSGSNTCKTCSELYAGCSVCDSDRCMACENSDWILTDNGCASEDESDVYSSLHPSESKPSLSDESQHSSSSPNQTISSDSLVDVLPSVVDSSSDDSFGRKLLIICIVGAFLIVAAIALLIVYSVKSAQP